MQKSSLPTLNCIKKLIKNSFIKYNKINDAKNNSIAKNASKQNCKLSLKGEGQHFTDRPKSIAYNYLLLFSLVCSPSNVLYVYTSAPCKSNGSNLTSNRHNPYFRCAVAPPKYHTAVVYAHISHSFTRSVEY